MLSGVLLHVIEPAHPVDLAAHAVLGQWGGQEMDDPVVLVRDIPHLHTSKPPGVEGLAAGGRVEGGAVEIDPPPIVRTVDDVGLELAEVGVGVVETLGHPGFRLLRDLATIYRSPP